MLFFYKPVSPYHLQEKLDRTINICQKYFLRKINKAIGLWEDTHIIKYIRINTQTRYASVYLRPPHHELHNTIIRPLKKLANEWEHK